jgi:hypothetical protein
MSCGITCLIGFAFIGSMVAFMVRSKDHSEFEKLLDESQVSVYKKIVAERLRIYLQGFFLGLVLAILVLTFNKKGTSANKVCLFIVIALGTNYLYYLVHPKSAYMLNYLKGSEQVDAWLEIYKDMKKTNLVGFILGILGYVLIAVSYC